MYRVVQPSGNKGQWICGIIVGSCGFTSGLGLGWTAIFFPKVKDGEVGRTFSILEESCIASIVHVGQLLATFPSGYIQDKVGRRCTLLIFVQLQLCSWILIFLSRTFWAILMARLMSGLWSGFAVSTVASFTGELAKPAIRGRLSILLPIMFLTGLLFQVSFGGFVSYDVVAITSFVLTFVQFVALANIPESVYSLLRLGKVEQAERNLKWLRGNIDIKEDFNHIKHHLDVQMSRKTGYKEIFHWKASRKAFTQALLLILAQRFSGLMALISFASQIFPEDWFIFTVEHYPIIWNGVNLLFLIISFTILDYVDRKVLLKVSTSGCFIFCTVVTVWFFLYEKTSVDMSGTVWVPYIALTIQAAFSSSGLFFIPIVFIGEVFPMNIKSKAACLIVFISYIAAVVVVQIFLPLKNYIGTYSNFLLYSITYLFAYYVSCIITETRKKSLEFIQSKLEGVDSEAYMRAKAERR